MAGGGDTSTPIDTSTATSIDTGLGPGQAGTSNLAHAHHPIGAWQNNTLITKLHANSGNTMNTTNTTNTQSIASLPTPTPQQQQQPKTTTLASPNIQQKEQQEPETTGLESTMDAISISTAKASTSTSTATATATATALASNHVLTAPSYQFNPNTAPFTPSSSPSAYITPNAKTTQSLRSASVPAEELQFTPNRPSQTSQTAQPSSWVNAIDPNIWTSNDLPLKMNRNHQFVVPAEQPPLIIHSNMSPVSPSSMNPAMTTASSAFQSQPYTQNGGRGVWGFGMTVIPTTSSANNGAVSSHRDPMLMAAATINPNSNSNMNMNLHRASSSNKPMEYPYATMDPYSGLQGYLPTDMLDTNSNSNNHVNRMERGSNSVGSGNGAVMNMNGGFVNPNQQHPRRQQSINPQTLAGLNANGTPPSLMLSSQRDKDRSNSMRLDGNANGMDQGSRQGSSNGDSKCNKELFKTELCHSFMETGVCRYGAHCQFAHGEHEVRPVQRHPRYKTKLCKNFSETGYCPYSQRCRFIHMVGNTTLDAGSNGGNTPNANLGRGFTGFDTQSLMAMQGLSVSGNAGNGSNTNALNEDDENGLNDSARSRLPFFVKLEVSSDDENSAAPNSINKN
eukprot:CAMPEP_0184706544 /NCGR_PEP_ID=MMETSP0313-20130426/36810_1 /TAXON_ID=2792 /ORGANISM="Porphyridium aerugineum, Strain SAG 1380-2" /LENGTH=619 /DNA_ID=CAMNT_0027168097 /DNA_START=354 /DNA_END=2213 /DNA_ORIENTATION=+